MKKINFIELLRFLASLAVILAHYMHFFNPFNFNSNLKIFKNYLVFEEKYLPFYEILEYFYRFGYYGVYFFWEISGFVLAYTYLNKKNLNFKIFAINRFSRLYPLHLFSLILIAVLQTSTLSIFNKELINVNEFYNGSNNFKDFVAHIFFISGWFESTKLSFNFPVWSVSIEIIVYFIFFFLIINIKKKIFNYIIIFSIFFILEKNNINIFFLECGKYFFNGVLIYLVINKIEKNSYIIIISLFLLIFSIIGNFKSLLFFSSIILIALYLDKEIKNNFTNKFSLLGNLTYSSYLLHIPIQILIIIIFNFFNLNSTIFTKSYFFISYILLVYIISHYSYKNIELPFKMLIRKSFIK